MYKIFKIKQGEDIKNDLKEIFEYWKETGFPNYQKEDYNLKKELEKIINFNEKTIFDKETKNLKQTMHGCGFLWTYFPHWIDVKCGNETNTLLENWNNDEKLYKLIEKTYKWQQKHGNGNFTINRLRQNSKVYLNKQTVSNFRPTVAKYIYNTFGNKGVVWDMSCGWGGRLLGFLASNCTTYIGTEPSTLTYNGLCKIKEDYEYTNKNIKLYKLGSEIYRPEKDSLDLCFTSPPYFDTEKYANEITQSYIKYKTDIEWCNGFLKDTINNCYYGLKKNGYMIINISNVKTSNILQDMTVKLSLEQGFKHIDTYNLILSSISGKGYKFEPVYIFKK